MCAFGEFKNMWPFSHDFFTAILFLYTYQLNSRYTYTIKDSKKTWKIVEFGFVIKMKVIKKNFPSFEFNFNYRIIFDNSENILVY